MGKTARRNGMLCPKPACPSGIHNTHMHTSIPTSEVKGHCVRPSDALLLQQPLPSDGGQTSDSQPATRSGRRVSDFCCCH